MSLVFAAERRGDALPALIAYVVLLLGVPAGLIFAPLGAAGTPSTVLAIGFATWWLLSVLASSQPTMYGNATKWLLLAFAASLLVSYVVGLSRPIASSLEVNSADRALLTLMGWCGVVLVVVDGVTERVRLDRLLGVVVVGAAVVALLGMMQFFFNLDIANYIKIPGLTTNREFGEVINRSAFRRVTGTATHPIEFGVVISAILPLALHYARFAADRRGRIRRWSIVIILSAALPLSVARSGILGSAIALAILYFTWPLSFRRRLLASLFAGILIFSAIVPGLLGTIRSLFLNAGSDPSTAGRTDDYGPTFGYFVQSPLFGRGFGTFLPELYRILDNQYLALLVEAGLIGTFCTLLLFVGSIVVGRRTRRRARDECTRDLAQSLIAGVAVLIVNAATFDLFAFSMSAGLLFLYIGCIGSLDGMSRRKLKTRGGAIGIRGLGIATVGAIAVLVATGTVIALSRPMYVTNATVVFEPSASEPLPPFNAAGRASDVTRIVHDLLEDDQVRAKMAGLATPDYDLAIGNGSLMRGTDRQGSGSVLHLVTRASTADASYSAMSRLQNEMQFELTRIQHQIGVPATLDVTARQVAEDPPIAVRGRPSRVLMVGVVLSVLWFAVALHVLRRGRGRRGYARSTAPRSVRRRQRTA